MDKYLNLSTLVSTHNPQSVTYCAMHQDYCSSPVVGTALTEEECGQVVIDKCLKFGHWGVLEHPTLTVNCAYVPHSAMQQLTRHRLFSFDVQSFRYTGDRLLDVANGKRDLEEVIYFRSVGSYNDRFGTWYDYTEETRAEDIQKAKDLVCWYRTKVVELGISEEHARGLLPFDYRQHFQMTGNLRSWLHLLNLRSKKNAQLEAQEFCVQLKEILANWAPQIIQWYVTSYKGHIAP